MEYEKLYLENLPDAECYEKSYMHRDVVTHVVVTKTDFIVTASVDGHLKFWKKLEDGIEFVKHFRSHLCTWHFFNLNSFKKKARTPNLFHLNITKSGSINALATNVNGTYLCTASSDKSVKIFDVINFDMINMIKLDFEPKCAEWIHNPNDAIPALAVYDFL